ncbi:MAG: hypothetical protein ACFE95_16505 [Candidatus Hodarchaeota archaeon]
MSEKKPTTGMIYNIAILSFLDKPVDHIIQAFLQKYPDHIENQEARVSLNFVSLFFETDRGVVRINLMQPISPYLIDKLARTYYHEKEGAIILFSKNNDPSFKAAKTFYNRLIKENEEFPIPIAFVELEQDESSQPHIDEPVILENTPHVAYYGINENADGFEYILRFIIQKYHSALKRSELL